MRVICFDDPEAIEAFEVELLALFGEMQRSARREFINEANELRYSHGSRWSRPANEDPSEAALAVHSAEWTIKFQDIVDHDIGAIGRTFIPVHEAMQRQFFETLYQTAGAAAERAGNIVDAKESSPAEAMLEMWRKIELGVDADGKVSLPQIHLGTDALKKFVANLEAQPPEYRAEIERIQAHKTQQALEREAERQAKFKQRPDE